MLAGLPYVVWPVGTLFILATPKREEPFLVYHAWQALLTGLALSVISLAAFLGTALIFRLLPGTANYLPGFLGMSLFFVGLGIFVLAFFTAVFLGWRATEGDLIRIPYIGDFAEGKMLDQTGMTRRQFMGYQEEARAQQEPVEEKIPFPKFDGRPAAVAPGSRSPQPGSALAEMEARRKLREAERKTASEPAPSAPRPVSWGQVQSPTASGGAEPSSKLPAAFQAQRTSGVGRPAEERPLPGGRPQFGQRSAPPEDASGRVKEVDLVRHYKDLKSATKAQQRAGVKPQHKDVLKDWLSSIDET